MRTTSRGTVRALGLGLALAAGALLVAPPAVQTAPPPHTFTLVSVEANGVKFWLPSTIVVHPGERVTLKLMNKLDGPHGFAIDAYGIQVIMKEGTGDAITFTAKKGLTSVFYCQLHPAHIGGQVVVLP